MNKTVLVIGSVTAEQYKDARLSVLGNGHKPKIVRTTFGEFFLDTDELLKKFATQDEVADTSAGDLIDELAARHYASFGDIGAFVVDQNVWDKWDLDLSGGVVMWADNARLMQSDYAPRWIAYADGKVEFAG